MKEKKELVQKVRGSIPWVREACYKVAEEEAAYEVMDGIMLNLNMVPFFEIFDPTNFAK